MSTAARILSRDVAGNLPITIFSLLFALSVVTGCSSSPDKAPSASATGPTCELGAPLPDGTCLTAGVPADKCGKGFIPDGKQGCEPILPAAECSEGTMPVLGKTECQPVGVPADECATGFSSDGKGGCEPIQPAADCPIGKMAVPGETQCHEPQPCGTGTWGDIPVDATTQYVDASYAGGDSDGTAAKPWTTIAKGLNFAEAGAVVAVAQGTYHETLSISKGVKLWGVCPSRVNVIGGGTDTTATLTVNEPPSGQTVDVHGLGISGIGDGVDVRGATGVSLTGVWVHDTGGDAYGGLFMNGSASVTVTDSLLESIPSGAIVVFGSTLTVQRTVVRNTLPQASDQKYGRGIDVYGDNGKPSTLTLTSSLLDNNREASLRISGSNATVERTVIRNTQPLALDETYGRGIVVLDADGLRGSLSLTGSLLDQNHDMGLRVLGSDATVEGTVIRNTQPQTSDQAGGVGIWVKDDDGQSSTLTLTRSQLDNNREVGVYVAGSDATIERTAIRNTQSRASDQRFGDGISIHDSNGRKGSLALKGSLLEKNHSAGLYVLGSDSAVEETVIRQTQARTLDLCFGSGIAVAENNELRGSLSLTGSLLDKNFTTGLVVLGSDAIVDGTVIRNTQAQPSDLEWGHAIYVADSTGQPGKLNLTRSLLDDNREAGVSVIDSDATVDGTVIRNTQAQTSDQNYGSGIQIQSNFGLRGSLAVTDVLLDNNRYFGLVVVNSDATVKRTLIQDTLVQSSDQRFGDALCAVDQAKVYVEASLLQNSGRASVGNFGSIVTLDRVEAICSPILFDQETEYTDPATGETTALGDASYQVDKVICVDCDGSTIKCKSVSEHLEPPKPVKPLPRPQ